MRCVGASAQPASVPRDSGAPRCSWDFSDQQDNMHSMAGGNRKSLGNMRGYARFGRKHLGLIDALMVENLFWSTASDTGSPLRANLQVKANLCTQIVKKFD